MFGITLGDPCGIGPEITLKSLKLRPEYINECILLGCLELLEKYNADFAYDFKFNKINTMEDIKEDCINVYEPIKISLKDFELGKVSKLGGECAFLSVKSAIEFTLRKDIDSVVTAPLNKEALHMAGYNFAGHTEIFGELTKSNSYAMLLWSKQLKCIHATTHTALRNAVNVKKDRIVEVIKLANDTLKKVGYVNPAIAVAGLNPHAGENGIFGKEEIGEITPAIEICKSLNINVTGPIAPDTVFLRAYKGAFDIVVAMYHDQGHIPLKLLAFDEGVNITVGLDVIRTSVDHGTAFDIAGKNIAKPDSMLEAIEIGRKL
ncbi:4-hydroxythreonine-4-phosphate dehydrogenase PdxA [Candidatus Epulonipiscium fishelsonii]|uniref:4-hydroxythreonine-4-phosphate dehydrogenase PdxA n=1 Tax=Candidatus Epulonipiscium fishelsonii TaxID=77094 RepID=A0ACC8XGN8_9FIRM|nr:4-hydroxythreonine-4-phosphate dehydrogenase PdxA [Epulopiscium sp. SCG-B05WGA-EpuloA1]ONI42747.1 4-hydroxythreonine-4-phosphate dehydrogenase PdxA [Epulopiscium sp. SCG-B11WGA-EpuloA1]